MAELTVRVRRAWWLTPYIYGLAITAALSGREPDWDRVQRVICRAVTLDIRPRASIWRRILAAARCR